MASESVVRITVTFERRDDGGLFVYSQELPGFVLSHKNAAAVMGDVEPALSIFLSKKFDRELAVKPLVGLREALEQNGLIEPLPNSGVTTREYAAIAA
ncbi:hypothetical protein [Bradyrhizobium glycinis]|uniref:hypothetical protein n=1 Tax=Bradyrhizobium glycinis TaxID=2751812 RepID=UPI0018D62152|nr:hypothetical protein [Bradyrhizobium glycinis]MBH5373504.1 hypothetical protein [Bradyrhizobium glycinis]